LSECGSAARPLERVIDRGETLYLEEAAMLAAKADMQAGDLEEEALRLHEVPPRGD